MACGSGLTCCIPECRRRLPSALGEACPRSTSLRLFFTIAVCCPARSFSFSHIEIARCSPSWLSRYMAIAERGRIDRHEPRVHKDIVSRADPQRPLKDNQHAECNEDSRALKVASLCLVWSASPLLHLFGGWLRGARGKPMNVLWQSSSSLSSLMAMSGIWDTFGVEFVGGVVGDVGA